MPVASAKELSAVPSIGIANRIRRKSIATLVARVPLVSMVSGCKPIAVVIITRRTKGHNHFTRTEGFVAASASAAGVEIGFGVSLIYPVIKL
jgi:hypothetical protein